MSLESATYIHELDSANPAPTDQLSQADDHMRLIKAALLATFPNIEGPVTATHTELNAPFVMPIGAINLWYGSEGSCPEDWAVCNGQTVARSDGGGNITTPDLRGRVVVGAGALVAQGATHGAATSEATTSSDGAHTHTVPAIAAHTHTINVTGTTGATAATINLTPTPQTVDGSGGSSAVGSVTGDSPAHTHTVSVTGSADSAGAVAEGATGSNGAHSHTLTVSTYQPALGLHYIMKV